MSQKENKHKLSLITNDKDKTNELQTENVTYNTSPDASGYQTNPFYERLVKFNELQKKKRFTVEDLLKW